MTYMNNTLQYVVLEFRLKFGEKTSKLLHFLRKIIFSCLNSPQSLLGVVTKTDLFYVP